MKIIPAIDLLDGNVVRLTQGDYNLKTVYNEDPLTQAEIFRDAGFSHIHVVDLNGAKEGTFANLKYIEEMVTRLGMSVQSGGGIRNYNDCKQLLDAGVSGLICSSMVVKNEFDWLRILEEYPENMILGLDVKDGKLAYSGWLETSNDPIEDFVYRYIPYGLQTILTTDISRDGMMQGPNIDLYTELKEEFPNLKIIASGGVSSFGDLINLVNVNTYAVVVGKAYYEHIITLESMMSVHNES